MTAKNFWTGKEITPQLMDMVNSVSEKMVLYKIMYKYTKPGEKEPRYNWNPGFMDHIHIMQEQLSHNPNFEQIFKADNPDEENLNITMFIVARYLATNRIAKQRLAGLPEWERKSTSQEYSMGEIGEETEKLMDDTQGFNDVYDIARMVYSMLRYEAVTNKGRFFKLTKKGVQ